MRNAYTVPVANGMHFRHGTEIQITYKSGRRVLERGVTPIELVGGALTVFSIIHGAGITGMRPGWTDCNGLPTERPKAFLTARPQDILADGELCICSRCMASEGAVTASSVTQHTEGN